MGLLREASSREKQTTFLYTSLAMVFVLLYLFLFPLPLPPEFTLVPEKATPLTDLKAERLTPGGSYFLLGDREGYWGPNGEVEQVAPRRTQASVWGDRVAWYDAARDQVVAESASGSLFTLPGERHPHWVRGNLFTFDDNRLGLAAWNTQGRLLWRKQFSSLVTSMDTTGKLTVVGTLDGRLQVFGADGKEVGGFQPGGSRLPVVYNVSVSPDDSTILVLAGVDPKRFLVLERGGAEFRPVFHKPLKETSPWATPLGFLNRGGLAYYQNEQGLVLLDPRSPAREVLVPTGSNLQWIEAVEGGTLVTFVDGQDRRQSIRVASLSGTSLLTLPFAAQHLFLQRQGSSLLLGVDQTLLRLEVRIQ